VFATIPGKEAGITHSEYIILPPANPSLEKPAPPKFPPSTLKCFQIDKNVVESIKNKAMQDLPTGEWVSTNDAIVASIWKLVTKARNIPEKSPPTKTTCAIIVNGRQMLSDSSNELNNYFGNLLVYSCSVDVVQHLIDSPINESALLVRNQIKKIDKTYILSAIQTLSNATQSTTPTVLTPFMTAFFGVNVGISDWTKFGFYNINFGNGTPEFVGLPTPPVCDGIAITIRRPSGGIDLWMGLKKDHMDVFEMLCKKELVI